VKKFLIGAVALLLAVPLLATDYAYERHVIVGTASCDSIRATDRGGANRFFDAYWTFVNPTANDARAVVYRLDGTTGAPTDSTTILIPAGATFVDYVYGDSCQFTNWDSAESCQVYMRGTKPVDRYGR
jgi:hypothetical protein